MVLTVSLYLLRFRSFLGSFVSLTSTVCLFLRRSLPIIPKSCLLSFHKQSKLYFKEIALLGGAVDCILFTIPKKTYVVPSPHGEHILLKPTFNETRKTGQIHSIRFLFYLPYQYQDMEDNSSISSNKGIREHRERMEEPLAWTDKKTALLMAMWLLMMLNRQKAIKTSLGIALETGKIK